MSQLHDLTATQQVWGLSSREISSRELTQHYLDRIERWNAELGAFVTVVPDQALAAADRADARLAGGERAPLLGLPIAIKDLYSTAGIRTTYGSAALAETLPTEDAWTVGLLREAGAVFVGKTNTPEFGAACFTHEGVAPTLAVTPYDHTRYASGSSAGAAVAVAAGLAPVAHGSDGAGSIRTPASTCHLVGIKPSRGLVSPAPATPAYSTGTEGPLARTVGDAALMLDVMARPWSGDLYGWSSSGGFVAATTSPPERSLRIAVWTETGVDGRDPHPDSVAAVARAVAALTELGHEVCEIPVPARWDRPVRHAVETWFATSIATAVEAGIPADWRTQLTPYTQHLSAIGSRRSGTDLAGDLGVLSRYASEFLSSLADFDVGLTPTTAGPPAPTGSFHSHGVENVIDLMLDWSCYTPWVNLAGTPAVSLPMHQDAAGLPHGVQLIGRHRQDEALVALAAQLEAADPRGHLHPGCWQS